MENKWEPRNVVVSTGRPHCYQIKLMMRYQHLIVVFTKLHVIEEDKFDRF